MFSRIIVKRRNKIENKAKQMSVKLNIEILSKTAWNQSSQEIMTFASCDLSK